MPRSLACGLISCAARMPCTVPSNVSRRINSRYRLSMFNTSRAPAPLTCVSASSQPQISRQVAIRQPTSTRATQHPQPQRDVHALSSAPIGQIYSGYTARNSSDGQRRSTADRTLRAITQYGGSLGVAARRGVTGGRQCAAYSCPARLTASARGSAGGKAQKLLPLFGVDFLDSSLSRPRDC